MGEAVPSQLLEEGGIFISAVVWLAIGMALVLGSVCRSRGVEFPPKAGSAREREIMFEGL
jgi:hypothetical protein